jgi:hypothetical protein
VLGFGLLSLCRPALAQSSPPRHEANPTTSRAGHSFDALKTLAGSWTGTVRTHPTNPDLDGPIQVTMRVASQGSLLVHEIAPGGVPEPTLIYLDGDRLTLVHYCDAGNRPRLVARTSTDAKTADFEFADISGSRSPRYLQQFVFTLVDADHHTEDWTFLLADHKQLHAHFDLKRASASASTPPGR